MRFEPILAENACIIIKKRYENLEKIKVELRKLLREIKGIDISFDIKYLSKFKLNELSKENILKSIRNEREKDIKRGFTTVGPHLEDLDFIYNGKSLKLFWFTWTM